MDEETAKLIAALRSLVASIEEQVTRAWADLLADAQPLAEPSERDT